jgi:hypothetical protein
MMTPKLSINPIDMDIRKILIPNKPHLDPIAAIYLLRKYGKERFPGVERAKIEFWEHSRNPSQKEITGFEKEGGLMIDVGGSLFDHHAALGSSETSTSLVASYLGIENNPEVSALIGYIREDDLEGLHNRYGDLAYIVKCMHKRDVPSQKVIDYIFLAIDFLQLNQEEWHYVVKKEYEERCRVDTAKRTKGKIRFGVIESDNVQVGNYGISVGNLSVLIQKRSSGHIVILTNKHHRINLREIVGAVRKRELELTDYKKPIDPRKMQFEGKNSLVPQWFFHRSLNAFMNGSDALNKAEPTKVPLEEIVNLVWYGITSEISEHCDCAENGEMCPFAPYGFSKCEGRKNSQV